MMVNRNIIICAIILIGLLMMYKRISINASQGEMVIGLGIVLYLVAGTASVEGFEADPEALKTYNEFAKKLMAGNGVEVPGNVVFKGNVTVEGSTNTRNITMRSPRSGNTPTRLIMYGGYGSKDTSQHVEIAAYYGEPYNSRGRPTLRIQRPSRDGKKLEKIANFETSGNTLYGKTTITGETDVQKGLVVTGVHPSNEPYTLRVNGNADVKKNLDVRGTLYGIGPTQLYQPLSIYAPAGTHKHATIRMYGRYGDNHTTYPVKLSAGYGRPGERNYSGLHVMYGKEDGEGSEAVASFDRQDYAFSLHYNRRHSNHFAHSIQDDGHTLETAG